jgi:hypothetical protein
VQDFNPDVEVVRKAVAETLSAGRDVVLVMHSYGGAVGGDAMKYFLDDNDGKNGKGKIVRMVWICAFVLPVGGSLMIGLGGKDLPWFMVDVSARICLIIRASSNRVPTSRAMRSIQKIQRKSFIMTFQTKTLQNGPRS